MFKFEYSRIDQVPAHLVGPNPLGVSMSADVSSAARPAGRTAARFAGAVLSAAAISSVADAAIAALAHAAGASHQFKPLTPAAFVPLTVIGILAGAAGWHLVRRRATNPTVLLRRLVPIVVAVSLVPDVALGVGGGQPGTSWTGVSALMAMHLAVAAVTVPIFRRLLP